MPSQFQKFLNGLGISENDWFPQLPATYIHTQTKNNHYHTSKHIVSLPFDFGHFSSSDEDEEEEWQLMATKQVRKKVQIENIFIVDPANISQLWDEIKLGYVLTNTIFFNKVNLQIKFFALYGI